MRALVPFLSILAVLPLAAAEQCLLFYSGEEQLAQVKICLEALPQGSKLANLEFLELNVRARNAQEARAHAQALCYGVQLTPSLVVVSADGRYRQLAGEGLHPDSLLRYVTQPEVFPLVEVDERMQLLTSLYEQKALIASPVCTEEELILAIMHCRKALSSTCLNVEDKQLVGLRLLYPLLLRQYTRAYKAVGAHTPETEAKLLEAVAALDTARDLDSQSSLGREAHEQRESLRRARLKARAYE